MDDGATALAPRLFAGQLIRSSELTTALVALKSDCHSPIPDADLAIQPVNLPVQVGRGNEKCRERRAAGDPARQTLPARADCSIENRAIGMSRSAPLVQLPDASIFARQSS